MAISLRLSEKEELLFKEYAKMHNITVTDLIKESVINRIQDECDLALFNDLINQYNKDKTLVTLNSLLEKE